MVLWLSVNSLSWLVVVPSCFLRPAALSNQMPNWKLRATFRDHSLGVQALSYLRGTLLSASFDWEIIAWDAERLEKIGTMAGHKAPVTAIAQVGNACSSCRCLNAIALDETGQAGRKKTPSSLPFQKEQRCSFFSPNYHPAPPAPRRLAPCFRIDFDDLQQRSPITNFEDGLPDELRGHESHFRGLQL